MALFYANFILSVLTIALIILFLRGKDIKVVMILAVIIWASSFFVSAINLAENLNR